MQSCNCKKEFVMKPHNEIDEEDLDLKETLTTLQSQLKKVNQEILAPLLHEMAYSILDLNKDSVQEVQLLPHINIDNKQMELDVVIIWKNKPKQEQIRIDSIETYAKRLQERYKLYLSSNPKYKDTSYLRKVAVEETLFNFRSNVDDQKASI